MTDGDQGAIVQNIVGFTKSLVEDSLSLTVLTNQLWGLGEGGNMKNSKKLL